MQTKINIVLLIDDASIVTRRLIAMLEDVNNSQLVLYAADYNTALKMMEELEPDYVLVDIGMSGRSGLPLLKEIRSKHSGSKVVVITNFTNPHYKEFCEGMGVNYFLDKTNEFDLIPGILTGTVLN